RSFANTLRMTFAPSKSDIDLGSECCRMSATLTNLLRSAAELHRAGDLARAEAGYSEVLERQPNHPQALYLLGILCSDTNRHERAIELVSAAIKAQSGVPEFHNALGGMLRAQNRDSEAEACFSKAIELRP